MKFAEHPDSRQATKQDLIDILQALVGGTLTAKLYSVPELRAFIRQQLQSLAEAGRI